MGWSKPEKFKLKHDDLDRFHRSEWSEPEVYSTWYAVYRVVLALLMSVGVGTHVYLKVNSPNPEWVIYMTNQVGILFKSIVQIFPGNRLAGSSLHPTCLAGPLGEV